MANYLDKTGVQHIFNIINSSWWNYKIDNKILAGDGIKLTKTDGILTITALNNGTVTCITAGAGLTTGVASTVVDYDKIKDNGTLSLATSGVTSGNYGPAEGKTLSHSDSFTVPYYTVDQYGRITASATKTFTLPGSGNSHYTAKNIVGTSATATSNGAVSGAGGVFLNLIENTGSNGSDIVRSSHKITGGGIVKVTSDANGNITITGTEAQTLSGLGGIGSIEFGDDTYISGSYSKSNTKATLTITHNNPVTVTTAALSASATGGSSAWGDDYVKGVTLSRDAKGHVTGLSVTSGKLPANPNSDTWRAINVNGTQKLGTGTSTGALNFVNGDNITITYDGGVKISTKNIYNKTEIDTKIAEINSGIANNVKSLLQYKGTIDTNEDLPDSHDVGDAYVVKTNGEYAGVNCQAGDIIICIVDGTTSNSAHWTVVQGNGQVTNSNATLAIGGGLTTIATVDGTEIKAQVDAPAAKGSGTKGIYINSTGAFAAMTYSLSSTVNSGAIGGLAYYSGVNAIDDLETGSSGQYLVSQGTGKKPVWTSVGSITSGNTGLVNGGAVYTAIDTLSQNLSGQISGNNTTLTKSIENVQAALNDHVDNVASAEVLGHIKLGYTQSNQNYPVVLDTNNKAYVNVPWSDTNTTYSAGTGITLNGTTFSHADTNTNITKDTSYGPTADKTQSAKSTISFVVPQITLDQFGHVKSVTERTIKVTDTDTNTTYDSLSAAEIVDAFKIATGITIATS